MNYRTKDMNLAAFLWVEGYEPKTEVISGQVWFLYGNKSLRYLKNKYYGGYQVSAFLFADKLKACKRLIHAALEATND